jgi:2,3-bisphosphoglycerate-independent phosphoglycerate mutase
MNSQNEQAKKIKLKYRPTMLAILDGCGDSNDPYGNAIIAADTPNLDRLKREHPYTILGASGLSVGLPDGQMGNSEVGHLNIGAGRVVDQDLNIISKSIESGEFYKNSALLKAMNNAKENHALHLMGLIGSGGVHSHQDHLVSLVKMAAEQGVKHIYIHAFLDGRDTPPRSAQGFMQELLDSIKPYKKVKVVSVAGRYYAMDRDNRWDRVQKAYEIITGGEGLHSVDPISAITESYERGENDEFVMPTAVYPNGESAVTIHSGDSVIFFNFRPDRAREITRALVDPDFSGFERKVRPMDLQYITLTEYDASMPNVTIAYPPKDIRNTLGEYLSSLGLAQLRIAETEKYAHVTFFFNGGVETPNPGEDRVLVASPKVATYDLQPEMSANEVTNTVIEKINSQQYDVIILNFANMDMVGHTGVFNATVKAVETVDDCLGRIAKAIENVGGQLLVTADHGNSDNMLTEDAKPITAHSLNPVPLILVRKDDAELSLKGGGILSDIVPTMLDLMGLSLPDEMTGSSLLVRKS